MTLCIAASCVTSWSNEQYEHVEKIDPGHMPWTRSPRIVLCADWLVQIQGYELATSAQTGFKFRWIKENQLLAAIAGEISKADDLISRYRRYFDSLLVSPETLSDDLTTPVELQKQKIVDHHAQMKFGINREDFMQMAGNKWPSEVFREELAEIGRLDLGCQLIIVAIAAGRTHIFTVGSFGEITTQENFAAIGSGSGIATPALYQREHNKHVEVDHAIYHVYEAARLAQADPGVGKKLTMFVVEPEVPTESNPCPIIARRISDNGITQLETLFRRFGLQEVKEGLNPVGYYEP